MKGLRARKQALLLESDLNRQILRLEMEQVRLRGEQLKRSYNWVSMAWKWTLPLVGLCAARKSRNQEGASRSSKALLLFARLWETWQALRPKGPGPGGDART